MTDGTAFVTGATGFVGVDPSLSTCALSAR